MEWLFPDMGMTFSVESTGVGMIVTEFLGDTGNKNTCKGKYQLCYL